MNAALMLQELSDHYRQMDAGGRAILLTAAFILAGRQTEVASRPPQIVTEAREALARTDAL